MHFSLLTVLAFFENNLLDFEQTLRDPTCNNLVGEVFDNELACTTPPLPSTRRVRDEMPEELLQVLPGRVCPELLDAVLFSACKEG